MYSSCQSVRTNITSPVCVCVCVCVCVRVRARSLWKEHRYIICIFTLKCGCNICILPYVTDCCAQDSSSCICRLDLFDAESEKCSVNVLHKIDLNVWHILSLSEMWRNLFALSGITVQEAPKLQMGSVAFVQISELDSYRQSVIKGVKVPMLAHNSLFNPNHAEI
jgi:hypothetical protein